MKTDDLVEKYKKDGKLLIEEIVKDYSDYLYKSIKQIAFNLSDEDIEDIILDTFLVVWTNRDKIKLDSRMKHYLVGITKNVTKNKCRKLKINYNIEDYENTIEFSEDIQKVAEEKEKNEIIKLELDKMKQKDREIFTLFYYNSMTIKEIANMLNETESNVKTKLHRIRKRLRKVLEKGGYSYGE